MKTLFVVLPQGMEKAQEAIEQIALASSTQLGVYLSILSIIGSYGWGEYDPHNPLNYIADDIPNMNKADYVAFTPDWEKYQECRLLHEIAEQYKLDIIECDVESEEPKLKACPFCKESQCINVRNFVDRADGDRFFVECNNCYAGGPVGETPQEAVEAWNKELVR